MNICSDNLIEENSGLADEAVERVERLDTATISDALDRLGIVGQCRHIRPRDTKFRMTGRAYTVLYGPAGVPTGTVGDYIDVVPAGSVVVLDNGSREDVTVWGDILTEIAHRRQIAGTVIDGMCRDVAFCVELNYPIFSKNHWMRTGKGRVQVEAVNVPVTIGEVRVAPGDIIRGDADGVVVIPKSVEAEVIAAAEEIARAENLIREGIRSGARLDDVRQQFSYHSLQSRKP